VSSAWSLLLAKEMKTTVLGCAAVVKRRRRLTETGCYTEKLVKQALLYIQLRAETMAILLPLMHHNSPQSTIFWVGLEAVPRSWYSNSPEDRCPFFFVFAKYKLRAGSFSRKNIVKH
jgi:hypothetical protein